MYHEIMVPLDGSKQAECALPHAKELAKLSGARITLLSVLGEMTLETRPGAIGPVIDIVVDMKDEAECVRRYLDKTAKRLRRDGLEVQVEVVEGDPASQICDYAKKHSVDLIIMSTHGRSAVKRWMYGSVAEKVLRESSVPVLLVRAKADGHSD